MFERNLDHFKDVKAWMRERSCNKDLLSSAKWLASGTYNDIFTYGPDMIMRLSYYGAKALKNMHDYAKVSTDEQARVESDRLLMSDPVRTKNNMSKIMNFLIKQKVTPHFAYTFGNMECKHAARQLKELGQMPKQRVDKLSDRRMSLVRRYNNLSFQERYDYDLFKFVKEAKDTMQSGSIDEEIRQVLFQVIFTMAVLQHYLPGFRHNDLSTSNILLKRVPSEQQRPYTYRLYNAMYEIRNPILFSAVHDFDLAHADVFLLHMGGHKAKFPICNAYVSDDKHLAVHHIENAYNPSFDLYFLLHTLVETLGNRGVRLAPQTSQWLSTLDLRERYRADVANVFTPLGLLTHGDYFSAYRKGRAQDGQPFDFGIRDVPLEVFAGPSACGHVPVTGPLHLRYPSTDRSPSVTFKGQPPPAVGPYAPLPMNHMDNVLYRFASNAIMIDYDAALIIKSSCQDQTLAKPLSLVTRRYRKDTCATLQKDFPDIYKDEAGIDGIEEFYAQLLYKCPFFFTKEDLIQIGRDHKVPEQKLQRAKSKVELCQLVKEAVLS